MFSREKLKGFAERMRYATICKGRAHSAYKSRKENLTARLPEKCFLPARSMPANITLKELCVCVL